MTSNPRGQQFGYPPDYYPSATDFAGGALIHLCGGRDVPSGTNTGASALLPVHIGIVNRPRRVLCRRWKCGKTGIPGLDIRWAYDFRDGSIGGTLPDGNYLVNVTGGNENVLTGLTHLSVNGGPGQGMVTLMGGSVVDVQVTEEFSNSEWSSSASVNDRGRSRVENPAIRATATARRTFNSCFGRRTDFRFDAN